METFSSILIGCAVYAALTILAVFIGGIYYGHVNDPYPMKQRKLVATTWPFFVVLGIVALLRVLWVQVASLFSRR